MLFDVATNFGLTAAAITVGRSELLGLPGTTGPEATVNTTPVEV